jgi:N-methylhydantoinase A/oxoprolinase/acetone carboxylase beta subunit
MAFDGPALIDQEDTTVLVAPGFHARVDGALDVILERR